MEYQKIWQKILKPGEEVQKEFSLGSRYITFIQIISGIFLAIAFFVIGVSAENTALGWFFFISYFPIVWFIKVYMKTANAFAFTDKRVLVHKGWLSTHLISVDYNKITDILVSEPFLEKTLFKTGNLIIDTAGTHLPEVILINVEEPYKLKRTLDYLREKEVKEINICPQCSKEYPKDAQFCPHCGLKLKGRK